MVSVSLLYRLPVVRIAAFMAFQDMREREMAGGTPWMAYGGGAAVPLARLAQEPQVLDLRRDFVDAVTDNFIMLSPMVDDLSFLEPVSEDIVERQRKWDRFGLGINGDYL